MEIGIEAVCAGYKDGGVKFVTCHPGSRSHDFFQALGGETISLNERIAMELAYGASMAGVRSVVCLKGSGLNACADQFLHVVYNGLNAGISVLLVDDVHALTSPEKQDSRHFYDVFGGLWLEPGDLQSAYNFANQSLDLSEKFDVPVVIRITNNFFSMGGHFSRSIQNNETIQSRSVSTKRGKYISYWKDRHDRLTEKNSKVKEFVESFHEDQTPNLGLPLVLRAGVRSKDFSPDEQNVFILKSLPLPEERLKSLFAKGQDKVITVEQGDKYIQEKIKSIIGGKLGSFISKEEEIPDKRDEWRVWNNLEKLFQALKSCDPTFVVGDEGQFTDESTQTIQVCLCMGSSVGICMGLARSGIRFPFCVTGDTSFLHSGKQSLEEAVYTKSDFCVIVIDNGGAKSTGGQIPPGDIHFIPPGVISKKIDYSAESVDTLSQILRDIKSSGKLSVLYVKTK